MDLIVPWTRGWIRDRTCWDVEVILFLFSASKGSSTISVFTALAAAATGNFVTSQLIFNTLSTVSLFLILYFFISFLLSLFILLFFIFSSLLQPFLSPLPPPSLLFVFPFLFFLPCFPVKSPRNWRYKVYTC